MAALIGCGVLWRWVMPGGADVDITRKVMINLVYYLLLPALVLSVLWRAPLGVDSLHIALLAALGVFVGLFLGWLSCRVIKSDKKVIGAVILAAGFPNATYLGLPVLEATFGDWSRGIAIQYDLFACLPLVLSVGVLIARHYGAGEAEDHPSMWRGLVKVPPLWAAAIAIGLNLSGVPMSDFMDEFLQRLGQGVSLLMLISLGMSLSWDRHAWNNLPTVVPVAAIQLIAVPLVVWLMALLIGVDTKLFAPIVVESAMPSMVLGLMLCERYGLNSGVYASAVTVSTAVSFFTLGFWFEFLSVS